MEKLERLCCLISPDQNGRNFITLYTTKSLILTAYGKRIGN